LTDIEEQAQKMAIRVARIYRKTPTVNVYEIDDNMALIWGLVYNSNCLLNEQKNNEKVKLTTKNYIKKSRLNYFRRLSLYGF